MVRYLLCLIALATVILGQQASGHADMFRHMTHVRLGSARRGASANATSGTGFELLVQSNIKEEITPINANITGTIPAWLNGKLVRNGPGQFEIGDKQDGHVFDGFAKLTSWTLNNGAVQFQSKFLDSGIRTKSLAAGTILPYHTFGPMVPPNSMISRLKDKKDGSDNNNVNTWAVVDPKVTGTMPSTLTAITDSPDIWTFDTSSLNTGKNIDFNDALKNARTSSAHPRHVLDGSGDSVNFVIAFTNPLKMQLIPFRMGADMVRRPIGSVKVPALMYIHSFALTENHIILVSWPVKFKLFSYLLGQPLVDVMEYDNSEATMFYVFDIHSTDPDKPPVAVFTSDAFYSFHHANAFEDGEGNISLDLVAFPDLNIVNGPNKFGIRSQMMNPTQRNSMTADSHIWRFTLPMATPGVHISHTNMPAVDAEGYVYTGQLPTYNEDYSGKKYCYIYRTSFYMRNSTEFADMGLTKTDMCAPAGTPTATTYFAPNIYPWEPIFVPTPNATREDDGVILSVTLDGVNKQTFLLTLNATDMTELGRATLPFASPLSIHGHYFAASQQ